MSGVWLRGGGVQRWRWRCALCAASGAATSQQDAESQFWWHYHTRHSKPHRRLLQARPNHVAAEHRAWEAA